MGNVEEEFRAAFERYSDELFRHCILRLSNRERALELTQECFLRAWEYARGGREIREMRPFLYRTLGHLIIDEYRKHKTHSLERLLEGEDGSVVEALMSADEEDALESAMARHDGARALAALQELPDIYREVLSLRYVDDFSPREIAECIGESENVVSVRIHRGLRRLRAILEPETPELPAKKKRRPTPRTK